MIGEALKADIVDYATHAQQTNALLSAAFAGSLTPHAAARYLAAHAPTMRAQGQTFTIAQRLQRGEHLFEE